MGEAARVEIVAADGHRLAALEAAPDQPNGAGLVVVQEIYGLNAHVRDLVTRFAALGFRVCAPALFDRLARDVELDYDEAGTKRGRELRMALGWDAPLCDVDAALTRLGEGGGKVGVIGFCWGGSLAFLSACRARTTAIGTLPACAVGYYGAQIAQHLGEHPRVPTLLHFGAKDALIPAGDVAKIRAENPDVEVHVHPAGHGFNCDRRADFEPASAARALETTLAFLKQHLG
jgi:carboxymethylenebutenolidase